MKKIDGLHDSMTPEMTSYCSVDIYFRI